MRHSFLALALASALGTATPAAVAADHSAELAALKAQLAELTAKVAELEARTDAQSDINIGTQQNIENIAATIREGRPNGMPAYRGFLPEEQIWRAARMYGKAKPSSLAWGLAVDENTNGAQLGMCLVALVILVVQSRRAHRPEDLYVNRVRAQSAAADHPRAAPR